MSFYPPGGRRPARHLPLVNRGCGCLIGLVAAAVAVIVLGLMIVALVPAGRLAGTDVDDPVTPAPSSAGSDWQPSGG